MSHYFLSQSNSLIFSAETTMHKMFYKIEVDCTDDVRVFQVLEDLRLLLEPVGDVALGVGLVQLLDGPR